MLSTCVAEAADTVLLDEFAPATALIPTVENGGAALGLAWTGIAPPANADDWISGQTGAGFETSPADYSGLIGLDLIALSDNASTAYVRIPFTVDAGALAGARSLVLRMKYDDGFIAYLNGERVAARNAPDDPDWQSVATDNHPDEQAVDAEVIDITAWLDRLQAGENMLAIHALNDGPGSSDLLILPQLVVSDQIPLQWPDLQFTLVASGFGRPVDIAHAGDGSGRIFVVEQTGRIRIIDDGVLLPTPFLDISARVRSSGNEQGLLGLAFPPDYATKGHFYVNYTSDISGRTGDTVVARFQTAVANPNLADPNSEDILLVVDQPQTNHNGGQIQFGPDGFLYIGMGDGGSGGDPGERAQNTSLLLGKMLRIDVEGAPDAGLPYAIPADNPFRGNAGIPDEIWAIGLRNPWRFAFDRATGDLWIGDVGQGTWEEVDFTPAGTPGGLNYGWDFYEADQRRTDYNNGTPPAANTLEFPVFFYGRGLGVSITGGRVYRAPTYPRMAGVYFFGDFGTGNLWGLQPDGGEWVSNRLVDTSFNIATFGEDESGELYLGTFSGGGQVYRLSDVRDTRFLDVTEPVVVSETGAFSLTFGTEIGADFQLEFSEDLITWTPVGPAVEATGLRLTLTDDDAVRNTLNRRYYRARLLE